MTSKSVKQFKQDAQMRQTTDDGQTTLRRKVLE